MGDGLEYLGAELPLVDARVPFLSISYMVMNYHNLDVSTPFTGVP